MKAKRIIAGALALVMAGTTMGLMTGCGDKNTSSTDGGKDKDNGKKVTLEVLTNRTDRVDDGTLAKVVESFEEENNCEIKWTAYKDYSGDVATRMATDDFGDVLMIPDEVELKDLGNFFEPIGKYDDFTADYQWVNKKMDSDKNVYGLAYGGTATGILYNKKVWADAGITEMPKTPDEFVKDLKQIADKTDAIPYYTEFADASWTITQWQNLVISASGNPNYENDLLTEKQDLFGKDGPYYTVYKMMYDVFSDKSLTEEDHLTTEWESSKTWFGEGKIATVVMGSWAVGQFQELAENPDDIGYMPVPVTAEDGKQYAETAGDYCVGVSKHSDNIELAKKFALWFAADSGFGADEGLIPLRKDEALPENLSEFKDCVLFEKEMSPDELIGKFDEIDKKSAVGVWNGDTDNFKIKMAEAAFAGKGEAEFDKLAEAETAKWKKAADSILG